MSSITTLASGNYGYITFNRAKQHLAGLLGIQTLPGNQWFWVDQELGAYIVEAIRTFGGLSRFYRQRGAFTASQGVAFYDLTKMLPQQRAYNVMATDLVSTCLYHLMEPQLSSGLGWLGTDQFQLSDVTEALTRATNQFLLDTSAVITVTPNYPASPAPVERVPLPDQVMSIRHINWGPDTFSGLYTALWPEDELRIDAQSINNVNPQTSPVVYSVTEAPQLMVRLFPAPIVDGTLELITLNATAGFTPLALNVPIGIPDDFTWVVKFGALADLYGRDGQARDPLRARYCQSRYDEGVKVATNSSSVLGAFLNGNTLWIVPYTNLDAGITAWRSTQAKPAVMGTLGLNMVALAPVPDQDYGIALEMVTNAIVPQTDSDLLQFGREELDVILMYAKHLACLKMGGAEFVQTMTGWDRLMKASLDHNDVLRAKAKEWHQQRAQAILDFETMPERIGDPAQQQAQQQTQA